MTWIERAVCTTKRRESPFVPVFVEIQVGIKIFLQAFTPLPSRTGLFGHLEKGAALPTGTSGGELAKSNELWLFKNVVLICELYNTGVRFSVELRTIAESGRTDFWLLLSKRAVGIGSPWPRKETPGAARHWCRGRGGSSSRAHPRYGCPASSACPPRSLRSPPARVGAAPGSALRLSWSLRWD